MMRKLAVALVALTFAFAGSASANYTIDLIWSDTGTKTLTVTPGDSSAPLGSSGACAGGYLFDGGQGRCLEVRLTAAAPVTGALVTLGWNAASSGLAVDHTGLRSFGLYGGGLTGAASVFPSVAGTADCSPTCDTAHGSFGGLATASILAGTYTLGSINFNTSGVLAGSHNILAFLRTGVDGVTDKKFASAAVQLNGAVLNVIPEPGTASLLGLGIMGLVLAGRRRKA